MSNDEMTALEELRGRLPEGMEEGTNLCLEIAYHVSSRLVVPWRPGKRAKVNL